MQSEQEFSTSGIPLTALYFDTNTPLLVSGDQSGMVRFLQSWIWYIGIIFHLLSFSLSPPYFTVCLPITWSTGSHLHIQTWTLFKQQLHISYGYFIFIVCFCYSLNDWFSVFSLRVTSISILLCRRHKKSYWSYNSQCETCKDYWSCTVHEHRSRLKTSCCWFWSRICELFSRICCQTHVDLFDLNWNGHHR